MLDSLTFILLQVSYWWTFSWSYFWMSLLSLETWGCLSILWCLGLLEPAFSRTVEFHHRHILNVVNAFKKIMPSVIFTWVLADTENPSTWGIRCQGITLSFPTFSVNVWCLHSPGSIVLWPPASAYTISFTPSLGIDTNLSSPLSKILHSHEFLVKWICSRAGGPGKASHHALQS